MKKIALALVAVTLAMSPAFAAKKKPVDTDPNANTWKLLKDGAPLILPTWALPIYFSMHQDAKK